MTQTMHKIGLLWLCLTSSCHGWQAQFQEFEKPRAAVDTIPTSQELAEGSLSSVKALAKLLIASNSEIGFNPSLARAQAGKLPRLTRRAQAPRLKADDDEDPNDEELEKDIKKLKTAVRVPFFQKGVPDYQQPTQEMIRLRESPFMDWADTDEKWKESVETLYWFLSLFFSFPIAYVTYYDFPAELPNFFLVANIGTVPVMALFVYRMKAGWSKTRNQLRSRYTYYEAEGSALIDEKDKETRFRDRLIAKFQVQPIIDRIDKTLGDLGWSFAGLLVAAQVLLIIQGDSGPYTLKTLVGDTAKSYTYQLKTNNRVAAEEQRRALVRKGPNGKVQPVYCNSRYYRILAGGDSQGGSGC